jgi:hypothetical protein
MVAAQTPPPKAECPHEECEAPEAAAPEPAPAPMTQDTTYESTTTYDVPPTYVEEPEKDVLEKYGIALSLGGGVSGFTDDTMRDVTDDGGAWGVRVAFGTRSPIAVEAEYIGSAQSIDALGLESDAVLVGNGLQAVGRVNILDAQVQPFLYGGIAWRHYNLADEGFNTSDIESDDDVLELPVGVGIGFKYEGFLIDARGEYRYVTEADMVPSLNDLGDNASMHRYGVIANIGYAF